MICLSDVKSSVDPNMISGISGDRICIQTFPSYLSRGWIFGASLVTRLIGLSNLIQSPRTKISESPIGRKFTLLTMFMVLRTITSIQDRFHNIMSFGASSLKNYVFKNKFKGDSSRSAILRNCWPCMFAETATVYSRGDRLFNLHLHRQHARKYFY